MEKIHTIEDRVALVRRLIKVAMDNILDEADFDKVRARMSELKRKDGLTSAEVRELEAIEAKIDVATVHLKTLEDFRIAMQQLNFRDELLQDTLAHENAHANKAESLGHYFNSYKLILLKDASGYSAQPSFSFKFDSQTSEEDKKSHDYLILVAPEEYGNHLSEGDKNELSKLNA